MVADPSPSPVLGDALGPWSEDQATTARDTLLEILDIARHLLEHGPDRQCRRISLSVGGVSLSAEFGDPTPEPVDEPKQAAPVAYEVTPYNLPFPGETRKP